jgi:hypothetical protein
MEPPLNRRHRFCGMVIENIKLFSGSDAILQPRRRLRAGWPRLELCHFFRMLQKCFEFAQVICVHPGNRRLEMQVKFPSGSLKQDRVKVLP